MGRVKEETLQAQLVGTTACLLACIIAIVVVLATQLGRGSGGIQTQAEIVNVVATLDPNTFPDGDPNRKSIAFPSGFLCFPNSASAPANALCNSSFFAINDAGQMIFTRAGFYTTTIIALQQGNVNNGQTCAIQAQSAAPFYGGTSYTVLSTWTVAPGSPFSAISSSMTFKFFFNGTTFPQLYPLGVFCQLGGSDTIYGNLTVQFQITREPYITSISGA